MTTSAFEAYNIFQSISNHFHINDYDAIRYNFAVKAKEETFDKRKDRHFFQRHAYKYGSRQDLIKFYLANVISKPEKRIWVGECEHDVYLLWKGRIESLSYNFKKETTDLAKRFETPTLMFKGNPPEILNEYFADRINLETLTIFDSITDGVISHMNNDTELFSDIIKLVQRYPSFLKLDTPKFAKIAYDVFNRS